MDSDLKDFDSDSALADSDANVNESGKNRHGKCHVIKQNQSEVKNIAKY